jgi:signal transduction histidine kinase
VVEAEASGDEVAFEVTDTGTGIAPEHLERVFERFYRVDKSRSRGEARDGSGVGLAISRALVEAMGGRIRVESPGLGEGATFVFTLPVSHPKS